MRIRLLVAVGALLMLAACGDATGDDEQSRPIADVAATTFIGDDPGDHLAASVTGDFNGDGQLDIALGATGGDGPAGDRPDSGEVNVILGVAGIQGRIDLSGEIPGRATLFGPHHGAAFGRGLTVGDYNSDGLDDLAVSAPLGVEEDSGLDSPGIIYVFLGSGDMAGNTIDLSHGNADASIRGADPGDGAGLFLLSGDFDGDAVDDLVIGAHLADGPGNQRPESGEVYVVSGPSLMRGMTLPEDAAATLIGAATGDHLGETISEGDLDGDGLSDLVAASTFADYSGQVDSGQVYGLMSPLSGTIDLAVAAPDLTIGGVDAGDQLGHSIGLSERDDEGVFDLWLGSVSADGPDNHEDLAGEVHLFQSIRMQSGHNSTTSLLTAEASGVVFGPEPKARLGRNATMAQLDGERGLDLAIAATDVLERAGEVYILFAGESLPKRANSASVIYRGANPNDILGHEAFGVPSLSGIYLAGAGEDGILVAAPGYDADDRVDCGAVYVVEVIRG